MVIPSPTCFQLLPEFVKGVYWHPHFSALVWTGFWGGCRRDQACSASFGNVKISDLDFTDDAVIFAETLDILLGALEVLNEGWSHLDYGFPGSKLRSRLSMTSWMLLSCLCLFVVRMLWSWRDSLTLAVIFMSLLAESEVNRHLGQAWGVMHSLDHGVWHCRYLCSTKL